jgi:hypothetical protein
MTPPPNELDALIRGARDFAGPPPDVAGRLLERLDAAAAGASASGAVTGGAMVSKSLLLLAGGALFLAGALAGGGAVWALRPEAPAVPPAIVVNLPPPPAEPPAPPEPAVAAPAAETPSLPPSAPRPAAKKPAPAAPAESSTLDEERRLLDGARPAIVAGAWRDALDVVAAHQARFPSGALAEEREAIAIQALAAIDPPAAAARAAAFRKRWPNSILEPVIEKVAPRDGNSATPQ